MKIDCPAPPLIDWRLHSHSGARKPDEKKPLSYASDVEEDKLGCYDSDEPRSVEPTPSTASLIIKA